jgi:hypothetical protein
MKAAAQAPPMQQPQSMPPHGGSLLGARLPDAISIPGIMVMEAITEESARCPNAMAEEAFVPLRIIPRAMTSLARVRAALRISKL